MMRGLGSKQVLRALPDSAIDDCPMLARMPNLPVPDLTEVDRVGEQFIERTAPEWLSAGLDPLLRNSNLRDDPVASQCFLQQTDRTEFEITLKDMTYGLRFRLIDHQTPLAPVVA